MPIFEIKQSKLSLIKEKSIDLEKDIQKITEDNLETVFGYKFIKSEFYLNNMYIDTLAFDPETKSFIIIEYKKDRSFSVIDQGFTYLGLMLNNQADFILEYNEKMNDNLKRENIDWSQSKVIFISPQFTPYQQGAINFNDLRFELWEVKGYENKTILYNQLKPASTKVSINTISKSKTVQKITSEFRNYSVDYHFKNGWNETKELYYNLKDKIMNIDSRIEESPQKYYIGFKIGYSVMVGLDIHKSYINVSLNRVSPKDLKDPEHRVKYRKNSFKNYYKHITDFRLMNKKDIDYAVFLIKQVYEKFYS